MLMVILGAGASYDSVPSAYWSVRQDARSRPPLAGELLDARTEFVDELDKYPACTGLVAELRARLSRGEDLEVALQAEFENISGLRHEQSAFWAFRFYLRGIIRSSVGKWSSEAGGATNFAAFVRRIERWRKAGPVVFVTFNYDALLEDAIDRVLGESFRELGDYVSGTY